MSTLHLAEVVHGKRAIAIRAVRACLDRVAREGEQTWDQATIAVLKVLAGEAPVGLVQAEADIVATAAEAFEVALQSTGAARVVIDLGEATEVLVPAREAGKAAPPPLTLAAPSGEPVGEAVDLSREAIEQRFIDPTPADFDPSHQAARAALVLMAAMDGKAPNAWYYAKAMGCATEDVDLWVEVGNLIAETFGFSKAESGNDA